MSSMSGVTCGTWQGFDSIVTELLAALTPEGLDKFFHGENGERQPISVL
jgi:hypothetical protein